MVIKSSRLTSHPSNLRVNVKCLPPLFLLFIIFSILVPCFLSFSTLQFSFLFYFYFYFFTLIKDLSCFLVTTYSIQVNIYLQKHSILLFDFFFLLLKELITCLDTRNKIKQCLISEGRKRSNMLFFFKLL